MKIVLFLGAGFSAAFDYPVMNNFLTVAFGTDRLSNEEKKVLSQLIRDAREYNAYLESSPTNLEDILSFAVMRDRLRQDGEPKGPIIQRILQRVYSAPTIEKKSNERYWSQFDHFKRFLRIDDYSNLKIITTNYDLMVECALVRLNKHSLLPFNYELIRKHRNPTSLYYGQGVPLFKLHGSVNWFQIDAGVFAVEDGLNGVRFGESYTLPDTMHSDYDQSEKKPVLIPPSFLKPDLPSPMHEVWAGASTALREADILVFVGYSFPPTDVEMAYFLASSLGKNNYIRQIVVCDPHAKTIVKRLRENSNYGSHFKQLLKPKEGKWEEINDVLEFSSGTQPQWML